MEDVEIIYHNDLGIAFKWKEGMAPNDDKRVQLVFRDMGFYLLPEEVILFSENIKNAKRQNPGCTLCSAPGMCERNILLRSPFKKMDFAVNAAELHQICDLVEGTLFKMHLEYYLKYISPN